MRSLIERQASAPSAGRPERAGPPFGITPQPRQPASREFRDTVFEDVGFEHDS